MTEQKHWLVISEDVADVPWIQHADCPTRPGQHSGPECQYDEYACDVGLAEAYGGLPWRHRDAPSSLDSETPLTPGRYPVVFIPGDTGGLVIDSEGEGQGQDLDAARERLADLGGMVDADDGDSLRWALDHPDGVSPAEIAAMDQHAAEGHGL